ncbi:MAG TPA: cob(I)yrinic acid a,c-diamide adenosyltransferase, partial [Trueperaceae bacterium]|nr:cob(I)yrinic acid a,c-diamide adenosyltransferase [Trueperaceae bacterium]
IYTRTGDAGDTALLGAGRVGKDDLRVAAYGSVDEANSAIGLARANLRSDVRADPGLAELDKTLHELQALMFELGADLATPAESTARSRLRAVDESDVRQLEALIDRYTAELPELTKFILPAGSRPAAALHLARAVVRRAEREVVALSRRDPLNAQAVIVLNRLSDLLFTLARAANLRSGFEEVTWTARKPA